MLPAHSMAAQTRSMASPFCGPSCAGRPPTVSDTLSARQRAPAGLGLSVGLGPRLNHSSSNRGARPSACLAATAFPALQRPLHSARPTAAATTAAASNLQQKIQQQHAVGESPLVAKRSFNHRACGARRQGWQGARCRSAPADSPAPADTVMLCGDACMLLATELSSDRIAPGHLSILAALLVTSWLLVAQAKGDYREVSYDAWSMEAPLVAALQSSAFTWCVSAPLVLGAFALLVCNGTLDAEGFTSSASFTGPDFISILGGPNAVPEVEIVLAVLWTVTAWRGLYAAWRTFANFL